MEYIRKILAKNLKDLREAAGLRGYEVAEKSGISQASYSRFEKGGWVSDPESLEKLASFYGVRSSRFFHDPDLDLSQNPPIKTVSFDEKLKSLDSITREHIESLIDGLVKKSL